TMRRRMPRRVPLAPRERTWRLSFSCSRCASLGRQHARVHAAQGEPAIETGVFDLHAAIGDDVEAGLIGDANRLIIDDAVLEPYRLRTRGDGVTRDLGGFRGLAEYVDDIRRPKFGGVGSQARIALDAVDVSVLRVDAVHVKAVRDQVAEDKIAGAHGIRAGAHHRDGVHAAEQLAALRWRREDHSRAPVRAGVRRPSAFDALVWPSAVCPRAPLAATANA